MINEPQSDVTAHQYLRTATIAVDAIRQEDSNRLIIADGLSWGRNPVRELIPLKIAQSAHRYDPMTVTHYRASWVGGSSLWPLPTWPLQLSLNQYLYGDIKREWQSPIVINGNFSEQAQLSFHVQQVTTYVQILVRADGKNIFDRTLRPGPGQGEWKTSTLLPQWNVYEATYDQDYTATIPAGTQVIQIEVGRGDWLSFSEIRITPYSGAPGKQVVLKSTDSQWGVRQSPSVLDEKGNLVATKQYGKEDLRKDGIEPWQTFSNTGIGVHVGEFGVYNKTPYPVALAWMKDNLDLFRDAGFGWALWELNGDFGVLNSGRNDVNYENYKGHKLDRAMLELLKQG